MRKFEYLIKTILSTDENDLSLNDLGAEGWELVSVMESEGYQTMITTYYFKRELEV